MSVGKKLAVVLSVVIVGVSAALFFSKENSPLRFWRSGARRPVRQASRAARRRLQPGNPSAAARPPRPSRSPAVLPPDAPTYHQSMRPVGTLLAPIDGRRRGTETGAAARPQARVLRASLYRRRTKSAMSSKTATR